VDVKLACEVVDLQCVVLPNFRSHATCGPQPRPWLTRIRMRAASQLTRDPPPHLAHFHASRVASFTEIMAAIYKPSEAIALLRPSFILPRIHPSSSRRSPLGRATFTTSRNTQATQSSTPNPTPGPQRKSITLTGDTGQVRWSDLSPGEKAVRTTQQSFNLVVVLVGVLATVRPHSSSHIVIMSNVQVGRRRLLSLL
jgi:hypothetical protein